MNVSTRPLSAIEHFNYLQAQDNMTLCVALCSPRSTNYDEALIMYEVFLRQKNWPDGYSTEKSWELVKKVTTVNDFKDLINKGVTYDPFWKYDLMAKAGCVDSEVCHWLYTLGFTYLDALDFAEYRDTHKWRKAYRVLLKAACKDDGPVIPENDNYLMKHGKPPSLNDEIVFTRGHVKEMGLVAAREYIKELDDTDRFKQYYIDAYDWYRVNGLKYSDLEGCIKSRMPRKNNLCERMSLLNPQPRACKPGHTVWYNSNYLLECKTIEGLKALIAADFPTGLTHSRVKDGTKYEFTFASVAAFISDEAFLYACSLPGEVPRDTLILDGEDRLKSLIWDTPYPGSNTQLQSTATNRIKTLKDHVYMILSRPLME